MRVQTGMQQDSGVADSFVGVFIWGGVLIALLVAFWIVWVWLRKLYFGGGQSSSLGALWTLDDLRQMRDRGELREDEYQTLRKQAIDTYQDKDEKASVD